MDTQYICRQMVRLLHSEIRRVNIEGRIAETYGSLPEDNDPFRTDSSFLETVLREKGTTGPELFCEKGAVYYGAFPLPEGGKLLLGPIRVTQGMPELAESVAHQHGISSVGYKLPYCDLRTFANGLLLLFHVFTGKRFAYHDLFEEGGPEQGSALSGTSISRRVFHHQETEVPHNPYEQEAGKLEAVQNGDLEGLKRWREESWVGEYGKVANDPLRQAKNLAVITIVLASRAAIRGGLLPELAFSMADGYILDMEESGDITRVDRIACQAELEFTREVGKLRTLSVEKNLLIERAKDYIFKHLHRTICLGELAGELGVHPNYLSALFHRTEGMTVQQYIRRQKIQQAENLLKYSGYQMNEIASYLSFSSQSHFSSCFKKATGMTPGQYRNQYGRH